MSFLSNSGSSSTSPGSHICLSFPLCSQLHLLLYKICTLQRVEFCEPALCSDLFPWPCLIWSHKHLNDGNSMSHSSLQLHNLTQWVMHSGSSDSKESACQIQEMKVWSLDLEDPLKKEMATHSSILAWRIPWTEEPGGYHPWGRKESDATKWLTHNEGLVIGGKWIWL